MAESYQARQIPGKPTHKREVVPAVLCLLCTWCQMEMCLLALLLTECWPYMVDTTNSCTD